MAIPSIDDLRIRLARFSYEAQFSQNKPATMGAVIGGVKIVTVAGRAGHAWVTMESGGKTSALAVMNNRVKNAYGLRVWVGPNEEGVMSVRGIRESEVTSEIGEQASFMALPDVVGAGVIPARQLLEGRVGPYQESGAYGLKVQISAFFYWWNGVLVYYPGGILNLTSNVPGTANKRRWVLVTLDPDTNAGAAINGTDYALTTTLTATHLADVDPAGNIPLAGVNLFNGQSSIDKESYFLDARPINTGTGYRTTGTMALMANTGWPSTTAGCAAAVKTEHGTNKVDIVSLDFDQSIEEYAQWSAVLPDDYDGGTLTAVFVWTAASGSGNVIWALQGRAYAEGDAIDQAWGTAQTVTDTLTTANDVHYTSATGAITLAGTPAAGAFVQFRVYRDADAVGDTLTADARLMAVRVSYTRS